MAYTKYTWQNYPNVTTPISKANLDHLETQYDELIALFNAHTILMAVNDDDPAPLTMGASTILARLAAGNIIAATPAELMALLSGSAGAEFLFNTQKIGGVVNPTTDQQVATKKYVDDNITTPATKEIYVNPHSGVPSVGDLGAVVDAGGEGASLQLLVPQDFSAVSSIEVIFRPNETGASMHFAITTKWGAYNGGENYNVHTETEAGRDIGATVSLQNLAHSISDLVDVAALAAGDLLNVAVLYDATAIDSSAYLRGLRLKYT